ncbi:TniQ family protein [Paraburkholderia sp. CNPSo 3076]|uniref:TniQ family protein n=1 Tax=Paraburkholderia sp. CNPSo 3076 TaxID=2940936 RepID=UPI003A5229B2
MVACTKLLSEKERFCPSCYRDDETLRRQNYNRILWSIDCAEVCPIHGTLLEAVAEAAERKPFTFWLRGLSRLDATSLANHETRRVSDEQVRRARLIAEFLDDIHQNPEAFANGASTTAFFRR